MGKRTRKPKKDANKDIITDERFSKVHTEARFKRKIPLSKIQDSRFKTNKSDFELSSNFTKYGRKNNTTIIEDYDEYFDKPENTEEDIDTILAKSRGDIELSSSDIDDMVEDEYFEEDKNGYEPRRKVNNEKDQEEIPLGDETCRLALINLDWDNITSDLLFMVFNSLKQPTGKIISVIIYPSQFGKEKLKEQEINGPNLSEYQNQIEDHHEDSDEIGVMEEFSGDEDDQAIRNYQLDLLRYYFAVVECDSVETAKYIYEMCDGREFEFSSNLLDLRFIPDTILFDDEPKESSYKEPINYEGHKFTTPVLTNSKVQWTWDDNSPERKRFFSKKFKEDEIENIDFSAYLAEDSDRDDDLINKYRQLISNSKIDDNREVDDIHITFPSQFDFQLSADPHISFNQPESEEEQEEDEIKAIEETTLQKYVRKKKERKQKRQEEYLTIKNKELDPIEIQRKRKSEVKELESVFQDDEDNTAHFNMKDIVRVDKIQKMGKGKKSQMKKLEKRIGGPIQDDQFDINLKDDRFKNIFEDHQFAIDKKSSKFLDTKAMRKILHHKTKK